MRTSKVKKVFLKECLKKEMQTHRENEGDEANTLLCLSYAELAEHLLGVVAVLSSGRWAVLRHTSLKHGANEA